MQRTWAHQRCWLPAGPPAWASQKRALWAAPGQEWALLQHSTLVTGKGSTEGTLHQKDANRQDPCLLESQVTYRAVPCIRIHITTSLLDC